MSEAVLRLKRNEERRLKAGHLWVFSNEVDVQATPLAGLEPGQAVRIEAAGGQPIGMGYVNPRSLICARLMARDVRRALDADLLMHRLQSALALRTRLFSEPCYRLVYGESDALPGLVVDRYGDVLVGQITTAGMERLKPLLTELLQTLLAPRALVWRNDGPLRALEGLPAYSETAFGEVAGLALAENGVRFELDLDTAQKTGWFYDHRLNRARLQAYVKDMKVLDLFSYVGGWGVQAAAFGAREVLCVDASGPAVAQVAHNARLNGVERRVSARQADAFEALKALRAERARFDVVILDPPAFIKRKKDLKEGTLAYQRLYHAALGVLEQDGILVAGSCSYHLPRERLPQLLGQAARPLGRHLQILEQGHQGPDHPVHPAIPETDYLKAAIARAVVG
ncbi:class I SAM-dependent rRNA methyltransferase [Ectothiorhodospiraceae bacterium 2226]|nr:class I SAM-dependent rRNA methyltransferase [Ectothiorhodospiraceae bacterium 2226]